MNKLLVALVLTGLVAVATARAQDDAKPKPTPEQKAARKAMLEKYDTNKDGKLDAEEKAKISEEDRAKMRGNAGGKKKEKPAKPAE
jgi:hypothetical protein